ncbi:hypothetical protein OIU78_023079 [Salix suchowensis]|nr:hypothetical protein OIU78_023079 [Salix suchowensis]
MELSINIPSQPSNQRDENFRKWKEESFPAHIPSSYDPKKMMDKKLYNYAAKDRFDELFDHLWCLSSMDLSSIIYSQGKNSHGDTSLHLAAGAGQRETTAILINKAKGHGEANDFRYILEMKNDRGNTALHEANDFRDILEMKNDRGNTALHEAVIHRHHAVARFLVSECSKLCYTENNDHESPLKVSCARRCPRKKER